MDQLEGFLGSEPVVHEQVQAEVPAEPVHQEAQGVIAEPPAAQETVAPQTHAEQEPPQGHVPVKAVLEERRKRQELEHQLAQMRAQFSQQPQQAVQPPPEVAHQAVMNMALNTAEYVLRTQFQDYDDVRDFFISQAEQNPYLIGQLRQSGNPALFAYEMGKKLKAMEEIGDPKSYEQRIREKVLAELQAQQQEQVKEARLASASDSLASARAVGGQTPPTYAGPPSLDEILASKRRK